MKRRWIPVFLLVGLAVPLLAYVGCSRGVDLRTAAELAKAQEAFDSASRPEDFLKVAAMYAAVRERGVVSGAAFYNEGNALMRAGQRGRAIAAYRQAIRYRPSDPCLKANLDYALGSGADSAVRRPLLGYLFFWRDWVGYPAKFLMAAAAALATFVWGVAALFRRRRLFARLAIAGVVITMLLSFAAGYDWYRFDYQKHGVLVQAETVARKGNAPSYQPAFTNPLVEGTEFTVVDRRGNWLLIRLPGDGAHEGWIESRSAVVY
ncbi:MAG TPA: tetratricopeptide repeat protein [Thermoguttaceae bacterium]|nr:tetratricopeptide repeat protein [Thermoguttaceae bacterium]